MTKGSESICDICGKNMPSAISIASAHRKYDFTISSSGKIWDICDACRRSFRKWVKTRKPESYFKDRLSKLPYSSSQTLKDAREILDILDKYNDEGEAQNANSN